MPKDFFPLRPADNPRIYAYEETHPEYKGLLKIGYSTRDVKARVDEQYAIVRPKQTYRILLDQSAMRADSSSFTDKDVHRYLLRKKIQRVKGEWFRCTVANVEAAILALRRNERNDENRTLDFKLRPEQAEAVKKTARYFNSLKKTNPDKTPHFLWNAKMRFGKTFAAYQLAKKMDWTRLLVLTFKPAVKDAWEEDLTSHVDFEGWQFVSRKGLQYEEADPKKPVVCFGSFQDFLGVDRSGNIKPRNQWVHKTTWDCVVLDEYHFGAWRDRARGLFESEDEYDFEQRLATQEDAKVPDDIDELERNLPVKTGAYLYLSGTPFRAINNGEFIEEQIYNWTYSDEQRAKANWQDKGINPYAALPRMVLLTYRMPDNIREVALQGEFNEFDLNEFFRAEGGGTQAKFKYASEVQKWLDLIRGGLLETTVDDLKQGAKRPPMPFSDGNLLSVLTHTFWFLPSVAACHAMRNMLSNRNNRFYHDYNVVVAAGNEAGMGADALAPVHAAMHKPDPLETKTITLSCGKLTTGVTVKPWTGLLMLRNSSSPETYFQAAFRVQSPWTIKNDMRPNEDVILKEECYIFDFAPVRALRQIAEYSTRLDVSETSPEKKVEEFISFLPILAYDGSAMVQLDATGVLEYAYRGTTATLLARRWESALLVNVDNGTLERLLSDDKALKALENIEGFRSLNQDVTAIISQSDAVKGLKEKARNGKLTEKQKKELTEKEKEYKSKRRDIQEKLIKFATRIPVFMYLTDERERTLKDLITVLHPGLFKKVTGLEKKDFELLVSMGLFNSSRMNEAVFMFRRYEDASLVYTGISKHPSEEIGGYDTTLSRSEYQRIFENQPPLN
ncbi:MAG TPA: GIY-YIG nuclease family protein [Anaerolineales bacterium]|nr:GIY-YIG nuclease family protein [Anaerolineales bacterium]HRQ91692.1 GIY-YIG nuclease family protein [Anaerolineales bacterium]